MHIWRRLNPPGKIKRLIRINKMPVKKSTNTIVTSEVVDFNMIMSSFINNQQKLASSLADARIRIIELEAQIANLIKA